ncbi:MAG: 5-methyl-dCTP pyrophosphohydrolase [Myxococcaceae bacterium]|nr:5-methyl-dCTP pyrophosphohydrolase [Myxococcaceae bacterium]
MNSGQSASAAPRGSHVVAVAGLIIRPHWPSETPEPRMLALRRAATNLAGPGLWETVSGRVEQGEQPADAVQREIAEESALEVEVERRPYASYAAQRRGAPMIVILYRARYVRGDVCISAEHDAFAWLTAAEFRACSSLLPLVTVVEQALAEPLL